MGKKALGDRHHYKHNKLMAATPQEGHDGRPSVGEHDDPLLTALWMYHSDKFIVHKERPRLDDGQRGLKSPR